VTAKSKADNSLSLATDYRPLELEKEIREFWEKNQIRDKLELLSALDLAVTFHPSYSANTWR